MATRIYTTAPVDYDGFGTVTLNANAGTTQRGTTVRLVEIQDGYEEWQASRYASGMHMAVNEAEWLKLVEYKLATIAGQLPIETIDGKDYFRDDRLHEYRAVNNPHDRIPLVSTVAGHERCPGCVNCGRGTSNR